MAKTPIEELAATGRPATKQEKRSLTFIFNEVLMVGTWVVLVKNPSSHTLRILARCDTFEESFECAKKNKPAIIMREIGHT
jgi:hypothetical protein